MSPELAGLQVAMGAALCRLTAEETQHAPSQPTGAWTIQQIVEHLRLTYELTSHSFETRIRKGNATKAKPTWLQGAGRVALLRMGYFPSGRIAPGSVCPAAGLEAEDGGHLADRFRTSLERMDEEISRAEALFGKKRAITHQVLGPLSAQEWRRFHLIHGLHHLKQIEAIRKHENPAVQGLMGSKRAGAAPS